MNTTILNVSGDSADDVKIEAAGNLLKEGKLVAFPTETVYGLGANALDEEAAARIYSAKGRPSDNPLIVHIADWDALGLIVKEIPPEAKLLADKFWPGTLTMIFKKSDRVPYGTTGGLETVAVRMPSHPVAMKLIRAGGGYIAAPSANTSGRPSPTRAEHVKEDLDGRIDMILDGGEVNIGLESTIVDLSEGVPTILRPGYITKEMLEEVLGKVEVDQAIIRDDSNIVPKAPGMKYRHYAPKADLVVVEGEQALVTARINELVQEKQEHGMRVGVICTEETKDLYNADEIRSAGSRQDEESIARHLFAVLREFDELDVDCIYSESFEGPGTGTGHHEPPVKSRCPSGDPYQQAGRQPSQPYFVCQQQRQHHGPHGGRHRQTGAGGREYRGAKPGTGGTFPRAGEPEGRGGHDQQRHPYGRLYVQTADPGGHGRRLSGADPE